PADALRASPAETSSWVRRLRSEREGRTPFARAPHRGPVDTTRCRRALVVHGYGAAASWPARPDVVAIAPTAIWPRRRCTGAGVRRGAAIPSAGADSGGDRGDRSVRGGLRVRALGSRPRCRGTGPGRRPAGAARA